MSLENFQKISLEKYKLLPAENSELFKHKTFFKDFEIENIPRREISFDKRLLKNFSGNISISPITESFENAGELIERNDIKDKFVQMNNAFFNSGLFIHVPKGEKVQDSLRLYSKISGNTFSKIVILVEEDGKLDIVKEDFSENSDGKIIFSESIEIFLKDGAEVNFSNIQNISENFIVFSNKIVNCFRDSKINWNLGHFGGEKSRSRVYNFMLGEGSSVEELEVAFGNKEQKFDTYSSLVHSERFTTGRILSKSIMRDKSQSLFKGMIRIDEKAKSANSYLAGHSMLLSKSAKADSIPGLEILTNDIRATHSASVSPIDEEKIFYLTSRGLEKEEAVKTISLGFIEPVISRINSNEIRSKIKFLLELKWEGKERRFLELLNKAEESTSMVSQKEDIFEGHYKYR